jgi:hypothetical protein
MKINELLNLVFVLGVVCITIISMISKAMRAKKEQVRPKPSGRKLPSAGKPPVQTKKPGVEDILQEILGEKPLRTKLNESQARKKRQVELARTEETAERSDAGLKENVLPASRSGYSPRITTLRTQFDEPEESTAAPVAAGDQHLSGAQAIRAMTRTELQQAIVLREVLGPPVSLR